jgi:hypothetical protein
MRSDQQAGREQAYRGGQEGPTRAASAAVSASFLAADQPTYGDREIAHSIAGV